MSSDVSIICVVKDDLSGLTRTLRSIETLTVTPTEVIVVSTSKLDLQELIFRFPLRILIQQPEGIYSAMNFGVQKTESEFLWFLNAGDVVLDENGITNLSKFDKKAKHDLYAFGVVAFMPNGYVYDILHPRIIDSDQGVILDANHQGVIFRRESIITAGCFDSTLKYAADSKLQDLLASKGNIAILPDILLSGFRLGGRSLQNYKQTQREIDDHRNFRKFNVINSFKSHLRIYVISSRSRFITDLFNIYCMYRQSKLVRRNFVLRKFTPKNFRDGYSVFLVE